MKNVFKYGVAFVCACLFVACANVLHAEEAKKAGPVEVDMQKPLPSKISLKDGGQIVFRNIGGVTITVDSPDKKNELLSVVPPQGQPDKVDKTVVVYETKRVGSGEITIVLPKEEAKNGKLALVRSFKISLTVKEAPSTITELTESDSGKTVTVKAGSFVNVNLFGIPDDTSYGSWVVGSVSSDAAVAVGNVDTTYDQSNPDSPNRRKFTAHFKANKPGTTSIYMEYKSTMNGQSEVRSTFSFTIEVK